ncbi:MAG: methyl-accepting chemotaxis protein [Candidatus Omnitrophica bacterium]|nr:methyl-accepting chemotaxis protein [Candidatus Omnitrophota bacterium]
MEEATPRQYKRRLRSVLIHKPMQREFTLVVISLLIISALTVGFVIHSTINQAMMGGGYRFGRISAYEVMSDVRYDLIVRVSLVLFVTILVIAIFGIFFLHRIAGPVYRFRRVLHRIAEGEIPDEVKLREGDFFTETADDLNRVLRMLRERRDRGRV